VKPLAAIYLITKAGDSFGLSSLTVKPLELHKDVEFFKVWEKMCAGHHVTAMNTALNATAK
jgi:hypothetical protein